jgi:hypothetical protein
MDVVGQGHRCAACTTRAQIAELRGRPDIEANLPEHDRAAVRRLGIEYLATGAGLVVLGAAVVPFAWETGAGLVFAGLLGISYGWHRRRGAG